MRSTTSITVDAESTRATATPPGRDRFLDVVRAIALARVVAWHTWSAAWLTWFPAMPAMFFASGALLDDSLASRGWWATSVARFRRLLPPFWVYGAVSVTVMVVSGWRPTATELIGWVVPVVDPAGSQELRGLWIPLWYVRAYVWFVLGAAVMRRMVRVLGVGAPLVFALGTVALWSAEYLAGQALVPLEVLDACSYGTFVAAGMLYAQRTRRVPGAVASFAAAAVFGAAAVVAALRFGPSDLVVNRSALLTVLVGGGGLALMVALRPLLAAVRGPLGRGVDVVVRRSLTIYLWHGFGLVAAAELVDAHLAPGPLRWVASLAVVVVVTAGFVVLFGWVEDRAAGRRLTPRRSMAPSGDLRRISDGAVWVLKPTYPSAQRPEALPVPLSTAQLSTRPTTPSTARPRTRPSLPSNRPPTSSTRHSPGPIVHARRWGTATLAVALVAVALIGSTDGAPAAEPLSGQAVVARAGLLDATTTTTVVTPDAVRTPKGEIEAWLARHPDLRTDPGLTRISGSFVAPDGRASVFTWAAGHDVVVTPVDPVRGPSDRELRTWWSMTKTATAVWLLRASEAGQVNLEDRLSAWVPEVPNAESITLEQLARHQSGIPSEADDSSFVTTPVGVLGRYEAAPELVFEPGSGFAYSRTGYVLLALALERATGTTWTEAMRSLGDEAGVHLVFDEEIDPLEEVTDPDGHGYHGRLWSSGGILSDPSTLAVFMRWALTEGVSADSMHRMGAFDADKGDWIYGIGLMPLCLCSNDGPHVRSRRVGLDSVAGTYAVDLDTTASVSMFPDRWFGNDGPRIEFYELESTLLDVLAERR